MAPKKKSKLESDDSRCQNFLSAAGDPLNFRLAIKAAVKVSADAHAAALNLLINFQFWMRVSANKLWRPAYRVWKAIQGPIATYLVRK